MKRYTDAGQLSRPAQVLALAETAPGVWQWQPVRRAWARIEAGEGRNLFSSVGIGARDALLTVRRQPLTLHNALSCGGVHYFLTSITDGGPGHLALHAAVVAPEAVTLLPAGEEGAVDFPGVLTERYAGHSQQWPMSVNDLGLVLVTPKVIRLSPGRLVEARGAAWEVLVAHELDGYKNEYEIGRTVDL